MSARVPERKRRQLMELLAAGSTMTAACKKVGISRTTGYAISSGLTTYEAERLERVEADNDVPAPIPLGQLSADARRALEDFDFFRRRYLARDDDTPWQKMAAEEVVRLLGTPDKEFCVMNMPPGSGKTTLFTHDIPAWLICRDRSIRILVGSHVGSVARSYARRLKLTLERETPFVNEDGEAAEAVICKDFGRFKPLKKDLWATEEFVVEQMHGNTSQEKEATVKAVGEDGGFLGGRFDLSVWDDLVTMKNNRHEERREQQRDWWKREAETRVEPGGALFLVGQRLLSSDLYRFNLDRLSGLPPEEGGEDMRQRKYHHITFPAHDEERCEGGHATDAAAWPAGCLLAPRRVTWRELASIRAEDPATFATVYQQEDADPESRLVPLAWLEGGTDPRTGEMIPGCLERDWQGDCLPPQLVGKELMSVLSVDPSPSKWWAVQWYCYDAGLDTSWLMNAQRRKMDAPDWLDRVGGRYVGLAEEWVRRSHELGVPIRYLIPEQNAAQKFMLQYNFFQEWLRKWGITLIPHNTASNKADPDYGVQTVAGDFRHGKVRIPWGVPFGRKISSAFVKELLLWPEGDTDDQVMAHWFYKYNLRNLKFRYMQRPTMGHVPSWVRSRRAS